MMFGELTMGGYSSTWGTMRTFLGILSLGNRKLTWTANGKAGKKDGDI